ncbi:MAG: glycosyl hydrolase family 28-related protein, partial [Geminicoccaceae bacterium]
MISRLLTRYSLCLAIFMMMVMMHGTTHAGGNMRQAFNADIPSSLQSAQGEEMLSLGYLDVTKPPYNADNSGRSDVTQALQEAIHDAYRYNLVTWFPKGTYLVSDQLSMIQQPNGLPGLKTGRSQRKYANILQGDSTDGHFPTIKLADDSQVRDDTLLVFKFIDKDGTEKSNRHYNAALR